MNNYLPFVSVIIPTRNRCNDLMRALESCVAQDYPHLEVLVYDDASTDDTSKKVKEKYPDVHLFTVKEQKGSIFLRNMGFHDARGEYIFLLDDDAYYTARNIVSQTVDDFDKHPEAAAVAIPYIEPLRMAIGKYPFEISTHQSLRSYTGCAHAVRRKTILDADGYRELLFHYGEERDLCIRLINCGHKIILGSSLPVVHAVSPTRDLHRQHYYGVRNTLLFDCLNVPQPYIFLRLISDTFSLIFYTHRRIFKRILYVLTGYAACLRYFSERKPVSKDAYRIYRSLPGHVPELITGELPAPASRDKHNEHK